MIFWVNFVGFCPIKAVTGIPCPGCGMTRAWLSVLRLDIRKAFAYHPMFWTAPVIAVFAVCDFRPFKSNVINVLAIAGMFVGIVICYIIRI